MNLIACITMTSREIAELTGKEHFHVMRDVRMLQAQLGDLFGGAIQNWIHPQNGQTYEEFALEKDTCLTLLLGYDAVARMKVVKRWQQLEAATAPTLNMRDPRQMAMAALQLIEVNQELQATIEQQQVALVQAAPKVAFVDRYVHAEGLKGFREVCKLLKANEARFREFVLSRKIMYRLGGTLTAHQQHIDAGRFEVRAGIAEVNEHAYTTTKFTPKGIDWIAGEWARHQLRQDHFTDKAPRGPGEEHAPKFRDMAPVAVDERARQSQLGVSKEAAHA